MSTPITAGTQLALDLAILSPDGEVVEETETAHPFRCQFGNSELPPGLERELDGKSVGHEFEITLSAEEAFGVHDPAQVISLPRAELPDDIEVAVGDLLPVLLEPEEGEDGEEEEVELEVVGVDGDAVTVDLNHPYAGRTLCFRGRVAEVD